MKTILKLITATYLISIFTWGCAGRNFVRPQPNSLSLGKTAYGDVIGQFGQPYREGTQLKNDINLKTISYAYSTAGGTPMFDGVTPGRSVGFSFMDDILVGHVFNSSYKEDSSYFDDTKINQIKKGETTKADVIGLLGDRYGEYIYPLIERKDEKALVYLYTQVKGSAFNLKFYTKTLIVTLDQNGIVSDVNLNSSGEK
jgi:hypothetical protein